MQNERVTSIDKRTRWESFTNIPLLILGAAFVVAFSLLVLNPDRSPAASIALSAVIALSWAAFAIDYVVRFVLTPRGQRAHFFRHNLIDLMSVFLPIFRALLVIGHLRDVPYFSHRDPGAVRVQVITYAALYAIVFVYMMALSTLQVERGAPGSTMKNFGDAIWWALVTITTVGYGDEYPVTPLGRVFAVILMFGGIAILGTASALVISVINERIGVGERSAAAAAKKAAHE